jgi:hypothetical protein
MNPNLVLICLVTVIIAILISGLFIFKRLQEEKKTLLDRIMTYDDKIEKYEKVQGRARLFSLKPDKPKREEPKEDFEA